MNNSRGIFTKLLCFRYFNIMQKPSKISEVMWTILSNVRGRYN